MLLLCIVSFKEFGSLVCLWHDVKLRKTQLEVRSLTATWSRDLWGHRVVVFLEMCQIVGWTAMANLAALRAAVFFAICEKPQGGGGWNQPTPAGARVNEHVLNAKNGTMDTPIGDHFTESHQEHQFVRGEIPLSVEILQKTHDHPHRKICESLHIRKHRPILNRNVSSWYVMWMLLELCVSRR